MLVLSRDSDCCLSSAYGDSPAVMDTTRAKPSFLIEDSPIHRRYFSLVTGFQVCVEFSHSLWPPHFKVPMLTNWTVDPSTDMSAARHANVLFVKKKPGMDNDLAAYCTREGIPHLLFENFHGALPVVKKVVDGQLSVPEALALGQV